MTDTVGNQLRPDTYYTAARADTMVSGLTTASSLIMSASIGIAVGIGEYVIAIGVSILCLIVLAVFSRIAKKLETS